MTVPVQNCFIRACTLRAPPLQHSWIRPWYTVFYLGIAKEILLPWLCITRIMANEATNRYPNQACRESDTAWQFTKILVNVPLNTREQRNRSRPPKKWDFVIFLAYKNLDWHSLRTKAVIEHRRHRFRRSSPFQPVGLQTGKSGGFV